MGLKTWLFGESSETVKQIIDSNFKILGRHLSRNMLSLSTTERELLSSDYLSDGLVVFDTTLKKWYEYKNGSWSPCFLGAYVEQLSSSTWSSNNEYYIPFTTHQKENPCVQLFILDNETYHPVLGGVEIDNEFNILLSTDLPFNGKVVVK